MKIKRILNIDLIDSFLFATIVAILFLIIKNGSESLGYNWQWYKVPHFFINEVNGELTLGPLIKGLIVTLQITSISFIITFVIGLFIAILRLTNSIVGSFYARVYLEAIRNTPLLIQLFFMYFVISPIFNLSGFWAAVIALSCFEGAYASEILRAGILSIDKGQWEAAYSLGGNKKFAYINVILPQALPNIAPPLAGQAISLVKDSALVSTIAIYDLTMQGQSIVSDTFLTFEVWFTIAGIYLLLTLFLSRTLDKIVSNLKPNN